MLNAFALRRLLAICIAMIAVHGFSALAKASTVSIIGTPKKEASGVYLLNDATRYKMRIIKTAQVTGISNSITTALTILSTGRKVRAEDYSWIIGVRARQEESDRCGGTLIGNRFVLTAAHCVDQNSAKNSTVNTWPVSELAAYDTTLKFGERELALDPKWEVVVHENYKKNGAIAYDAALLRLAEQPAGATIAPVRMEPVKSGDAIVSGWGDHPSGASGALRAEKVPVVPLDQCQTYDIPADMQPGLLCSAHRSFVACSRDSGGPLVIGTRAQPQTIGIVSYGDGGRCGEQVAGQSLWSVYTNGSAIAEWVKRITKDASTVTNKPAGPLMPLTSDILVSGGDM